MHPVGSIAPARTASDRLIRLGGATLAVIGLTVLLTKAFGSIVFAPWATGVLVSVTARLGIFGDEAIEDFYIAVTALLSLLIAVVLVWAVWRGRDRLVQRG